MTSSMRILTSAAARSLIRERGGMLFVWAAQRGHLRVLRTSTEPPGDAFDWQRLEAKEFLVFLPPRMRHPRELHLEAGGWIRRRIDAFWNGCAYVL
jgi:hypothetical protein